MTALPEQTLATIAALYDAALDHTLWPDALAKLTKLTGSQASTFWILDAGSGSLDPTFVSINFDQRVVDDYVGGIASLDPTIRYLLAHPAATIVDDGMLGPGEDDDTLKYMDWHERNVETRYRLVGQNDVGLMLKAGVALHRARRAGRYDRADIEHFKIINAHVRRALAVGVRLGSLATQQQLTADLLDQSVSAIALLDAGGRVVFMNRAAEELKDGLDGIRIGPNGIHLALRQEDEQLQALIGRVIASRRPAGDLMPASRPSGSHPYSILVSGVAPPPTALTVFRPAVYVLIRDPTRPTSPPEAHLKALFGMTQAEARLAVRLASGETLQSAANELGITYGTARSRLTNIFQKTDTQSQVQLVKLMLSCSPR